MNTIKTAIVVILLLAVLYGVYVVLNKPEAIRSRFDSFITAEVPLQIEAGVPFMPGEMSSATKPEAGVASPANSTDSVHLHSGGSATHTATHEVDGAHDSHVDLASGARAQLRPLLDEATPKPDEAPASRPRVTSPPRVTVVSGFNDDWRAAVQEIAEGRFKTALARLSVYYNSPDLTSQQAQQLLDVLDPLAAKVIYSTEHLLTDPYLVRRGDTLKMIADRYSIAAPLLRNINQVRDPDVLVPGRKLKVMQGPFRAEVDLQKNKLTLFLGDLYAGWFPLTVGNQPPEEGSYQVQFKEAGWGYYAPNGQIIPARHATNPYGDWYIDLGGTVSIHGSPAAYSAEAASSGCISLSPRDAADVYGILSVKKSQVIIRR